MIKTLVIFDLGVTLNLQQISLWETYILVGFVNLAYLRWTWQSSIVTPAHKAVDGNANPDYFHGSCTQTRKDLRPWWVVDLEQEFVVTEVTITNRGECCGKIVLLRCLLLQILHDFLLHLRFLALLFCVKPCQEILIFFWTSIVWQKVSCFRPN